MFCVLARAAYRFACFLDLDARLRAFITVHVDGCVDFTGHSCVALGAAVAVEEPTCRIRIQCIQNEAQKKNRYTYSKRLAAGEEV